MTIKDMGFPIDDHKNGNLIITFNVVFSAEQQVDTVHTASASVELYNQADGPRFDLDIDSIQRLSAVIKDSFASNSGNSGRGANAVDCTDAYNDSIPAQFQHECLD